MKNKIILIISIIIILIGGYVLYKQISKYNNFETFSIEDNNKIEDKDFGENYNEKVKEKLDNKNADEENVEKILIHITGEVVQKGVVYLEKESRIIDAINAAGGVTENANMTKVNLAYILEDGMKVTIPSIEDGKIEKNTQDYIEVTMNEELIESSNNDLTKDNLKKDMIININIATQTELETLPGIGPSTALKIINYRKANGKFENIEDVKNVSGIGDSKFEKIKKYIIV